MKTKLLIVILALFIFSFKISSPVSAYWYCTVYCPDRANQTSSYSDPTPYCKDESQQAVYGDYCEVDCSGTDCPAPTDTPAPPPATNTPVPTNGPAPTAIPGDPCSAYANCGSCLVAQQSDGMDCGWDGGSCVTGGPSCPAGWTQWYWNNCSANVCPTPTPVATPGPGSQCTPGVPDKYVCYIDWDCTP
jgi:hypothetical protein